MDLSEDQAEAIRSWARTVPNVRAVYLFGSRAKGTSLPDSDVDLALVIDGDGSRTPKALYAEGWLDWLCEIEDALDGLRAHLVAWRGEDTPVTTAGVKEAGAVIFERVRDPATTGSTPPS